MSWRTRSAGSSATIRYISPSTSTRWIRQRRREPVRRSWAARGDSPVYLTFDIDALDPSAAPGTGTPVVGGPSTDFARKVLIALRGINIVGADMVEVLPDKDFSNITCIAAATLAQDLMYLLNENRRNQKK